MNRWRFLPSYHYEDNTDGKIDNPAELQLRDYTIEGNCGENILTYPYPNTTGTRYDVTFSDNGDGSITVSGTATDSAYFMFSSHMPVNKGDTFTLRANSQGKSNMVIGISRYKSASYGSSLIREYSTTEDIYTYTVKDDETKYITVFMKRDKDGKECTGTFKPELLKGKVGNYNTTTGKYEVPIKICGKNMFKCNPYTTPITSGGLTIQYLENEQCFLINGTSAKADYGYAHKFIDVETTPNATYSLSTRYVSGSIDKTNCTTERKYAVIHLGVNDTLGQSTNWMSCDLANTDAATLGRKTSCKYVTMAWFYIHPGIVFDNYKVKIQLEHGTVATAYEPYTEPRTQTISLDSPVGIGESVSMRADNLPAITLNKGSNIITVETDIAPTGVTYQYYTY